MDSKLTKYKNEISVIILCGGSGQRLRPLTKTLPKPLVKIKNKSMLEYIINHFLKYKIKNITIAAGYRHNLIKNSLQKYKNKKINVINTGLNTEIIDRLKKIFDGLNKKIILCYGDTLVDINLNKLINYYENNKDKIAISCYELKSTFGILDLNKNNRVKNLKKNQN